MMLLWVGGTASAAARQCMLASVRTELINNIVTAATVDGATVCVRKANADVLAAKVRTGLLHILDSHRVPHSKARRLRLWADN